MDVYEEIDEVKSEIEKLKEQYRVKAELAESLRRAHNDQQSKNKEASSKLEKLGQELTQKDDELSNANQMFGELKSKLTEKESIIRQVSSAHDKLRFDCSEKLSKFEDENKALASALDDANAKNFDQEQQICALKQEIEGVKRLFTYSKKSLESESKTKASNKSDAGEDEIFKLGDEKRKLEDQLKWKKEQFAHLEEAHKKLRCEFKKKEKEWEKEKISLLDGISSLQANLESQTRISSDLQRRLEMCNQALAHAESKRKLLEIQLWESRTSFDSVCAEYDDAKLNFENLAAQRDQEIANLRSSLGTKEILCKEMEYQFKKLEQEKKELLISLKELQEDNIREAGFSYSSSKLKSLEQAHKECSTNLKAKESVWRAQMEKLTEELNSCRSELKHRDTSLKELNRELEACDSLILELELLNQETSLLEKKKAALNCVQKDLDDEREKVVLLSEKVQTLEALQFPLQKEVVRLKEMLTCRERSEEQVVQIQCDLKRVHDALDRANKELDEKFCEANEIEFELQIWKSIAEQLEMNLIRNLQMRQEVEASLFAQMEVELNLKLEKECLFQVLEEKDKRIDDLQQQLVEVKTVQIAEFEAENNENTPETMDSKTVQNAEENEALAQVEVGNDGNNSPETMVSKTAQFQVESYENTPETTERIYQLVEEKDQRIYDLQQLVASLEKEFESSTTSFSSKLRQMQKERNVLRESWETVKSDEVLKEMEIQEKNFMVVELENDLRNLRQLLDKQEKKTQEIQAELEKKALEVQKLECELGSKIRTSNKTNEKLANTMCLMSGKMDRISVEDVKLMECLGKIVESFDISGRWASDDYDDVKENVNVMSSSSSSSPLMKKVEGMHDERSPLRAIN
ncbi:uncharacterized protein at4g38062 [Phtheirospermum japonicum]|uniref:Uncharacterized protein at4g38062 n=1 Tax=Phtheirospermum japonicum TaxID=374723 RepID=A0A830C8Y2_9LAMI|nr:uncharacterized protein at4g38062 [Phtheirospermum japonicum]